MFSKKILVCLLALVTAGVAPAATAAADEPAATRYSGTLRDGATWIADVPTQWNGTVVLFSHGFRPGPDNPAVDAPDQATADALLARGFALAGSSYAHAGWALDTAVRDQLDTLAALTPLIGEPRETIAFGQSMGGLVSAMLAEDTSREVDGVLSTCGLVGGALNLNNYQLDGTYALAKLLLPGQRIQLTGFTNKADADQTASKLTGALQAAHATAVGRARIAMAAALMNAPTWYTGPTSPSPVDWTAQLEAQYNWMLGTLPFVLPARVSINALAGGDSSWNSGVSYTDLLRRSARSTQVAALYRQAGLDLRADLGTLDHSATITPVPEAVHWLARTSTPTGRLAAPELNLHTTADGVAPVEFEREYANKVERAGKAGLLRLAYVPRVGHCAFTPAEYVAGVLTVQSRIHTGTWRDSTEPGKLQAFAESLGLGDAAFTRYRPAPFVNDRADGPATRVG